jgi:hypothetical protein
MELENVTPQPFFGLRRDSTLATLQSTINGLPNLEFLIELVGSIDVKLEEKFENINCIITPFESLKRKTIFLSQGEASLLLLYWRRRSNNQEVLSIEMCNGSVKKCNEMIRCISEYFLKNCLVT